MKTLSGFILLTVALAAQLPHLNAAPAEKAVTASSKLMALAEAIICLIPGQKNREAASVQSYGTGHGFVTDGCREDFLSINPQLETIQAYEEEFDIEVSCRTHMHTYGGQLKPCTRVTLKRNYFPYHDVYVDLCDFSDRHIEGDLCRYSSTKRLQQGDNKDRDPNSSFIVTIPIASTGKSVKADVYYNTRCRTDLVYLAVENFRLSGSNHGQGSDNPYVDIYFRGTPEESELPKCSWP